PDRPITKLPVVLLPLLWHRAPHYRCLYGSGGTSLFREGLAGGMSGTLDAIGSRANSIYPPGMFGVPVNLGSYGGMFSDHLMSAPGLSSLFQNAQKQMVDKYPDVIARDQSAEVMYSAPGAADVRVDLQFADDMGDLWRRRHGQQPEPVMEDE
ncbi:hypothetical protein, partial [Gordonia sp. (in: high G+C Gram-positive bacteria)]